MIAYTKYADTWNDSWTTTYWTSKDDSTAITGDDFYSIYTWDSDIEEYTEQLKVIFQPRKWPFWCDGWGIPDRFISFITLKKQIVLPYFRRLMFPKSGWIPKRCRQKA